MDLRVVLAADIALAEGRATVDDAAEAIREGRLIEPSIDGDARRMIVRRGGVDRALDTEFKREVAFKIIKSDEEDAPIRIP